MDATGGIGDPYVTAAIPAAASTTASAAWVSASIAITLPLARPWPAPDAAALSPRRQQFPRRRRHRAAIVAIITAAATTAAVAAAAAAIIAAVAAAAAAMHHLCPTWSWGGEGMSGMGVRGGWGERSGMVWRLEGSTGRPRGRLGAGLGAPGWPPSVCAGLANVVHSWRRRVTANRLAGRQLMLYGWDLLHGLCREGAWDVSGHAFGSLYLSCGCCSACVGGFGWVSEFAGFIHSILGSILT